MEDEVTVSLSNNLTLHQSFEDDCIQIFALLLRVMDSKEVSMIQDPLNLIVKTKSQLISCL